MYARRRWVCVGLCLLTHCGAFERMEGAWAAARLWGENCGNTDPLRLIARLAGLERSLQCVPRLPMMMMMMMEMMMMMKMTEMMMMMMMTEMMIMEMTRMMVEMMMMMEMMIMMMIMDMMMGKVAAVRVHVDHHVLCPQSSPSITRFLPRTVHRLVRRRSQPT